MNYWDDFDKRFASQGKKYKGDLFEQFCKALIAQFRTRAWHYVKKSGDDLDKPEDLEAIIERFKSRGPT